MISLSELRKLYKATTRNPWSLQDGPDPNVISYDKVGMVWITNQIMSGAKDEHDDGRGNGEFIVKTHGVFPLLVKIIAEQHKMLKSLEWSYYTMSEGFRVPACPQCGRRKVRGHGPRCKLKALLKSVKR
jgi:hypothetical protein